MSDNDAEEDMCNLITRTVGPSAGVMILQIMNGRSLEELADAEKLKIEYVVAVGKLAKLRTEMFHYVKIEEKLQMLCTQYDEREDLDDDEKKEFRRIRRETLKRTCKLCVFIDVVNRHSDYILELQKQLLLLLEK